MQFTDHAHLHRCSALVLLVICMIVSLHVERSRFGRSLLAIKQNEPAAEAAGINALRWKMLRHHDLSGAMAAAAGGLLCGRAAGGHAADRVRRADLGAGADRHAVRRRRHVLGAGDRRGDPDPARRDPARRARATSFRASRAWFTASPSSSSSWSRPTASTGACAIVSRRAAPRARRRRRARHRRRRRRLVAAMRAAGAQRSAAPILRARRHVARVRRPQGRRRRQLRCPAGHDPTASSARTAPARPRCSMSQRLPGRRTRAASRFDGHGVRRAQAARNLPRAASAAPSRSCAPFPRMTVLENVVVGAYVGATTDDEARARSRMTALERVGMADEQAHALAGGLTTKQLRLMELARALAPRPQAAAARRDARGPRRTSELEDMLLGSSGR